MIKTPEDLRQRIEKNSQYLAGKFDGACGKRAIVLCGGTGCLSSNSKEIREKFEQIIEEKKLGDRVTVNQVGCFGFCSQGPFVKIFPEDTLYRLVKLEDVEEIIEKDIVGGEIVERLLYVDPASGEKVQKQDDINFYKKQHRIALYGCGTIDPENIDEALGFGAYSGLAKALSMERQAVMVKFLRQDSADAAAADFQRAESGSLPIIRTMMKNMLSATVTKEIPERLWTVRFLKGILLRSLRGW